MPEPDYTPLEPQPLGADVPEPNPVLYRLLRRVLIGPALHGLGRPFADGLEHVPSTGGVIIASNHLAVVDSFYLALMVKRPICYLAKREYFEATGVRGAMARWVMNNINQIPVHRTDGAQAGEALQAAAELVRSGRAWGVYPEGTRSPDGRLYRGRTGVARVAAMTGAPVVPVAMINTRAANPPGSRMVRPVRVGMRFGEPLHFTQGGPAHPPTKAELRAFTDKVMASLRELGGQEYTDEYAPRSEHRRGTFK